MRTSFLSVNLVPSCLVMSLALGCAGESEQQSGQALGESSAPTPTTPSSAASNQSPDSSAPTPSSVAPNPQTAPERPGVLTPIAPPSPNTPGTNVQTPPSPLQPTPSTTQTSTPGVPDPVNPPEPQPPNGGAPPIPEPEGQGGGNGGETSVEPEPAAAGMPPMLPPGDCDNMQRDGDETAIDCGGSCPACPGYPESTPDPENEDRSGCEPNGNGFMCPQAMLFSPSMKEAVFEDWGMDDPPFAYAVVGHDPDPGGVDDQSASYSSTCCQCYQLVFKAPRAGGEQLPPPKPLIVQAFNTYAGGPSAFDVYMAAGGYGNFNGCTENGALYSDYPDMGGDWTGGVRATRYGQCAAEMGFNESSVSSQQCQDYVAGQCAEIQASELVQSISQQSCVQSNRIDTHYHTNWNVVVKRVECPEALTKVTGCRLGPQGLPAPDPAIQTAQQAMQAGFRDGDYHTTTMQDCCRPTCAWPTNVNGTTSGYSRFYTCDGSGTQR